MGKLWKSEEDKLMKSGRKWAECDEYLPYRYAELFCEKCGKSMGKHDIVTTNLQTLMYCQNCVKPYILKTPFDLTDDKEIVFDKPFYYFLRNTTTGEIIFMGKVNNLKNYQGKRKLSKR